MKNFPVELISVDSVMVYKDCNIGSAKPDKEILKKYPHHLIDIKTLDDIFTVSDFCVIANKLITEAHKNEKLPVLVGGSMMYFKSLFDGMHDLPQRDEAYREELKISKISNSETYLHELLQDIDPAYANLINENDDIRIIRALEIYKNSNKKMSDILKEEPKNGVKNKYDIHQFGIHFDREILHKRIEDRLNNMFDEGLIDEVKSISKHYRFSDDHPIKKAVNYKQVFDFLSGKYPEDIMLDKSLYATRQLAKRQDTWMRGWEKYIELKDGDPKILINNVKNLVSSL